MHLSMCVSMCLCLRGEKTIKECMYAHACLCVYVSVLVCASVCVCHCVSVTVCACVCNVNVIYSQFSSRCISVDK